MSARKLFWDLETTVKNKGDEAVGDFKASPFHPKNFIVLHQLLLTSGGFFDTPVFSQEPDTWYYSDNPDWAKEKHYKDFLDMTDMVVGHNIKFDLLYALRYHPVWREWLGRGGKIYDTALAEYLISGQTHKYPSLNACSKKYGGTVKDDRIREYWDSGFETEDIPRDQLEEYGKYDVLNTRIVYEAQQKIIDKMGIRKLVESNMEALLATIEMEFNGMFFDKEFAIEHSKVLEKELENIKSDITAQVEHLFPEDFPLNLNSPHHLSAALFGGTVKYTQKRPILDEAGVPLRYGPKAQKAGQVKLKNTEIQHKTGGLGLSIQEGWESATPGVYFTNESVLKSLQSEHECVKMILSLRELEKDLGTYFKGYTALVWHDGCIHGQLNTTQTGTGRLSSSKPNLQNLSK